MTTTATALPEVVRVRVPPRTFRSELRAIFHGMKVAV